MTKFAVVSGRKFSSLLAEYCARDFEDAILAATAAELICPEPATNRKIDCSADVAIVVGLTFDRLSELLQVTEFASDSKVIAYVFGAYKYATAKPSNPISQWRRRQWYGAFAKVDCLYLGFDVWTDDISNDLDVETAYLPMAADVMAVNASPFSGTDRPISVAAFGRQHEPIVAALSDALNQQGSSDFLYYPNFLVTRGARDITRYRDMFWQALRHSKISLAFDHFAAPNEVGARCSYVGPRWFESLAAGTVVAGIAPRSDDRDVLLDWSDATIELPDSPEDSVAQVRAMLNDTGYLAEVSKRNLAEMNKRHDWRHRLAAMFEREAIQPPATLTEQLERLAKRASAFQQ